MPVMRKKKATENLSNDNDGNDSDDDEPATNKSLDDWLKIAPTEVREMFSCAREVEKREKLKVVNQLLANVEEVDKPTQRDRLMRRSIGDLLGDLTLVKNKGESEPDSPGARRRKRRLEANQVDNAEDSQDALANPMQRGGWKSIKEETDTTTNKSKSKDDLTEEEWIASAPEGIRNKLKSYEENESQERRELIEALTANVIDDDVAERLETTLAAEPISKLRDLVAGLAPKPTAATRPNYFGSSTPPTTNLSKEDKDDVLPLPAMSYEPLKKAK